MKTDFRVVDQRDELGRKQGRGTGPGLNEKVEKRSDGIRIQSLHAEPWEFPRAHGCKSGDNPLAWPGLA